MTDAISPILEVCDLARSYDEGRIEALRGVSLSIAAGEHVAITGPSGSGKSTLLYMLGGLDTPTSGRVLFRGAELGSGLALDRYRARKVGFIFQAFHLVPTLRAIENVQVPMLGAGLSGSGRAQRAAGLLREMGMEHRALQYPNQLSAGERQRVAIARALANEPEILLCDEPTGNLDSKNTERVLEILTTVQRERGMTLIVVTHENEVAHAAARQLRMRDGRLEL